MTFPTTTVLVLARLLRWTQVEGILRWAVLVSLACGSSAVAQQRPVHWLTASAMPPGAIGSLRLHRGGPLSGYYQPVRIRAPQGVRIALAGNHDLADRSPGDLLVGMQIGPVYQLRVGGVPNLPGVEIFPTVEVIDRLYPPPGLALRYPIPVELTQEELEMAAAGAFVTRVIYVEDPKQALPVTQPTSSVASSRSGEQPWIEAPLGEDPLVTADRRGRPVAILRMGGRVPSADMQVASDCAAPPFIWYDTETDSTPSR